MTLTLSDEEREVLGLALAQYVEELRREINHTDDHAFRGQLERQQHVLQAVASRLSDTRSPGTR